jgi:hypothetical protein
MSKESSPYDVAIVELETTLRVLKGLRAQAIGPSVGTSEAGIPQGNFQPRPFVDISLSAVVTIPEDAFSGMMIAEAAEKYFRTVGHVKTIEEIAESLEGGGLEHDSIDFVGTLRTTLAKHAHFTRINNLWGLTEWFPQISGERPIKKLTLEQKILKAMGSEPGSVWLPRRMALVIHANLNSVQSMMSAMAQQDKLHKERLGYSLSKPKPVAVPKAAGVA